MARPRFRCAWFVLLAIGLGAASEPAVTEAAFPGRNGKIAWFGDIGGERYAVKVVQPGRRRALRLTKGFEYLDPYTRIGGVAFSPDGRWLVYGADSIFVRRPSKQGLSRALARGDTIAPRADGAWYYSHPDFSPDGTSVVFDEFGEWGPPFYGDADKPFGLRIWQGGHVRPLTVVNAGALVPDVKGPVFDVEDSGAWSVHNWIAFTRRSDSAGSRRAVYVIRPDGSGLRRVTTGSEPDWSPAGGRLVYVTPRGRLATISPNGRAHRRLTRRRDCRERSPAFSPDGRRIAFIRFGCSHGGLYAMRRNGSRPRRLVAGEDGGDSVDWQPVPRRRHR